MQLTFSSFYFFTQFACPSDCWHPSKAYTRGNRISRLLHWEAKFNQENIHLTFDASDALGPNFSPISHIFRNFKVIIFLTNRALWRSLVYFLPIFNVKWRLLDWLHLFRLLNFIELLPQWRDKIYSVKGRWERHERSQLY